jgi:hypothetical protein
MQATKGASPGAKASCVEVVYLKLLPIERGKDDSVESTPGGLNGLNNAIID